MQNRLKSVRLHEKLTLKEVSDSVGIKPNTLSQYENGKREPKLEMWQKLANFFDISIPYLQGTSDIPTTYKDNKIINYYFENRIKIIGNEKLGLKATSSLEKEILKEIFERIKKGNNNLLEYIAYHYNFERQGSILPVYRSYKLTHGEDTSDLDAGLIIGKTVSIRDLLDDENFMEYIKRTEGENKLVVNQKIYSNYLNDTKRNFSKSKK